MGTVQRLASVAVNDGIAAADEAMAEIQRPILRSADSGPPSPRTGTRTGPVVTGRIEVLTGAGAIGMTSSCPS